VATFEIHHGDNRDVLKAMEDNSIDSIVTDPPYELGFMGKSWDASGIAFNTEVWQECLRVLKPGGHLLAFSGSRTYHRMAVAIEDAGFEIRDQIMWIYGSGFPKSLDVSKAIDKAAGAERPVIGKGADYGHQEDKDIDQQYGFKADYNITAPATAEAKQWQGWGTALKPAHEPIVVARKPLIGTVAANVLTYGTGGLNIDGTRVAGEPVPINKLEEWSGFGQKIEPDYKQTMNTQGRWPANVIHDGSDAVVELFPNTRARGNLGESLGGGGMYGHAVTTNDFGAGDSGSAARFFYCAKASKRDRNEGLDGFEVKTASEMVERKADSDGMKSPRAGAGRTSGAQNHHPTVKPTELMRYLCRLVTPPGGTVLDPFMGSGSTGKAAIYEGFNFVGIEMTDEYIPIAKARIEFAVQDMEGKLL
jgi:site-specific DNA-methyltransferase (adenine-specific)